MIPQIENLHCYTRKSNTLFGCTTDGQQIPLVRFKQYFPDLIIVQNQELEYMKKYMEMWPQHWENLQQKSNEQLSLF